MRNNNPLKCYIRMVSRKPMFNNKIIQELWETFLFSWFMGELFPPPFGIVNEIVSPKYYVTVFFSLNPHPHMRGPCGPQKTLTGAPAAIFGTPEPTVYLIVHNTGLLSQTTLFFPSGTVMALKPWHNASSALGSVRTPQYISCDSIIEGGDGGVSITLHA